MKRSGYLFAACIGMPVVLALPVTAAEPIVLAQDLLQVKQSGSISAALWTRRPDSYTLQLVLPTVGGRSSYFIGNTIANLRGLDPAFGTRTLTLVDGRRVQNADESATPPAQPVAAKVVATPTIPPQIKVWLLRADGTVIPPTWRSKDPVPGETCSLRCIAEEIMYRFPLAEGAQAVAAAVQVDENFYIEKLQPMEQGLQQQGHKFPGW